MNILFRADSSYKIGTGHIMRDLVLASQYKDSKIIFATQNLDGNINHKITEAGYKIEILKSNDIQELDKLIKKYKTDMIIIDHYGIDYKFEEKLKTQNPTLKIMILDDTYEKHHCDILLNHNISANQKKYKNLVPKDCELRCGGKYTLLRDEFIKEMAKNKLKKIKKKKASKFKIFIAMGGADSYNMNLKILKILKQYNNIKIHITTTSANQGLSSLQAYVKRDKNIRLHVDKNNIAKVISKCDFGIVTPSVIVNEVINLGLPIISIMVAENQLDMHKFLKGKKIYVLKKNKIKKLTSFVDKMFIPKNYILNRSRIRKLIK